MLFLYVGLIGYIYGAYKGITQNMSHFLHKFLLIKYLVLLWL
jgi:hypothetical protein